MIKIEELTFSPSGLSLEPEFHIIIKYSFRNQCIVPITYNGSLVLDSHRFSFLHETINTPSNEELLSSNASKQNYERSIQKIFVAPLSQIALNKIDEKRKKDPKGELKFTLFLNITVFEPEFEIVPYAIELFKQTKNYFIPATNNQSLFKLKIYAFEKEIKISSGDWLHEYCPVFQNSKYLVFELPIPNITNEKKKINKQINEAINSLSEMEAARLKGEWNNVIKESRPVWELIKHKEEIKTLLLNDGMNEHTVESYNNLIESFFDFSSKFIHKESKTKDVMKANKANKEDAELVYAMAFSIVNLISKKLK